MIPSPGLAICFCRWQRYQNRQMHNRKPQMMPLRCFGWRDAFDDAVTLGAANNPTTGTSRLCAEPDISNIPLPLALAG